MKSEMALLFLFLGNFVLPSASTGLDSLYHEQGRCELITIPMCEGIGYNYTRMPNIFGHTSQEEATAYVHEFKPLVKYGCHEHLLFFLCSLYAPMCSPQTDTAIPACRTMCDKVRLKCAPVMESFTFHWPDRMDCSTLPTWTNRNILCMIAPGMVDESDGNVTPYTYFEEDKRLIDVVPSENTKALNLSGNRCHNTDRYVYLTQTKQCTPRCDNDVLYRMQAKHFAELWISIWSILCFVFTALTIFTFFVNRDRFHYPERPIVFISICYNMYSVAYIIRLIAGPSSIACEKSSSGDISYLIQNGLENTGCTIVFLIQYYFYMASSIWWVILTFTWFLAAGMKWGYEAIAAYSSYYHLAAWALPAVKTIAVLLMRLMDGEELTGMCFVGNQDKNALGWFVIAPLFIYYTVGTLFILAGFFFMFRIREVMKSGGTNIDKLEKLMVRIGVFSVMYLIPASCVIGCLFYQHRNMDQWKKMALNSEPCPGGQTPCYIEQSIPSAPVMYLKIFMLLVVGITSGMWIWSTKTVQSWQDCITRIAADSATNKVDRPVVVGGDYPGQPGVSTLQRTEKHTSRTSKSSKGPTVLYSSVNQGSPAIV